MKIILKDKVYVQWVDIKHLVYAKDALGFYCPDLVFYKYTELNENTSINEAEFVEFKDIGVLEFFSNFDCVIDYATFIKASKKEMAMRYDYLLKSRNYISQFIHYDGTEKHNLERKNLLAKYDYLTYQILELNKFEDFRHGKFEIELPKGVGYPKGYSRKLAKNKRR